MKCACWVGRCLFVAVITLVSEQEPMLAIWVHDGMCCSLPNDNLFLLCGGWKFEVRMPLGTIGDSEMMVLLGVGNMDMLIVYK